MRDKSGQMELFSHLFRIIIIIDSYFKLYSYVQNIQIR